MSDTRSERDDEGAWTRLRHRKVAQWGFAYAAGARALLQVVGFAADAFHWPHVIKPLSMLALALVCLIVGVPAYAHVRL